MSSKTSRAPTGAKCFLCEKEAAKWMGLINLDRNGVVLKSLDYAIGSKCYRKQWKGLYPDEPCPV